MALTITDPAVNSDYQWSDTDNAADSLNIWEMAAVVSGGTLAVNGVALMASLAPSFTAVFGTTAAATAYVGYCKRHGLDFNPTTWEMFKKSKTAAVASPQPAAVTDTKGNAIEVENL